MVVTLIDVKVSFAVEANLVRAVQLCGFCGPAVTGEAFCACTRHNRESRCTKIPSKDSACAEVRKVERAIRTHRYVKGIIDLRAVCSIAIRRHAPRSRSNNGSDARIGCSPGKWCTYKRERAQTKEFSPRMRILHANLLFAPS